MESFSGSELRRLSGASSATAAGGALVVPGVPSVHSLYVRAVREPVPDRTRKCPVVLPDRFETVWEVIGAMIRNVWSLSANVASVLNWPW